MESLIGFLNTITLPAAIIIVGLGYIAINTVGSMIVFLLALVMDD